MTQSREQPCRSLRVITAHTVRRGCITLSTRDIRTITFELCGRYLSMRPQSCNCWAQRRERLTRKFVTTQLVVTGRLVLPVLDPLLLFYVASHYIVYAFSPPFTSTVLVVVSCVSHTLHTTRAMSTFFSQPVRVPTT